MANRVEITDSSSAIPDNFNFTDFIESTVVLNGQPFRFNSPADLRQGVPEQRRDYLYPIYNNFYYETLLVFGRQCEKSTFLANKMLGTCALFDNYTWLYLNASLKQVGDFSRDKLDACFFQSPVLVEALYNSRSYNVHDKNYKNGASIKLRGMLRGADRARGISCDGIAVDEIQDILMDDIYVAAEAQSHSHHPERRRLYCGTPKTETNTIEQMRRKSTQQEIVFTCQHCNKQQIIEMKNVGVKGLICSKCGKLLNGSPYRWCTVEEGVTPVYSFRIPQVIVPWVMNDPLRWKDIVYKRDNYPVETFQNEVMARSWGSADRPITAEMLRKCCDARKRATPENRPQTVIGIDYGRGNRSYTVIVVVQIINGRPYLIYAHRYKGEDANPLVYIEDIIKLFHKFGALVVGTDAGDGFMQNKTLLTRLGKGRVLIFQACGNLQEDSRWSSANQSFNFSRTKQLSKRFAEIQMELVTFYDWEECKDLLLDFTNVYSEERSHGRIVYDHDEDAPDDFVHAWNNALMAAEQMGIWLSPIHHEMLQFK